MAIEDDRKAEHAKYERAYQTGTYRMKPDRRRDAACDLRALPIRGSYLDVSCGYGDMLKEAEALGYRPLLGTEVVAERIDGKRIVRAEAHTLPFEDQSFNVVSMFDVIEHLLVGDDELACRELRRVARNHILITANNRQSCNHLGEDLHVNKRPYEEWHGLFEVWFAPCRLMWLKERRRDQGRFASSAWRVDL